MRKVGALLLVAACLVGSSSAALAQPRDTKKTGDALFKEGRAAFDRGDFATACSAFQASQDADPAPGTLLNLAVCEDRIGKLLLSRKHIAELVPQLKAKDDRLPFANDLAGRLDARIPDLTLNLKLGAPADTWVHDAADPKQTAMTLGVAVKMDPGDRDYLISANGRPDARLHVHLVEGQHASELVAPGDAQAGQVVATVTPEPASDGGRSLRRTLGFVGLGVGVAGIALAGITGASLISKKSALDAQCPNKQCNAMGEQLLAADKSTALVPLNTTGWIVGAVGIGAGGALLISTVVGGNHPASGFAPIVGPGVGGLRFDAHF